MLIDRGCDLNLKNEADLLASAAAEGHADILQLHLDRGTSVDVVSGTGQTPLMAAAEAGQCDTVAFPLDRGANVSGSVEAKAASVEHSWGSYYNNSECDDSEEDEGEYEWLRPSRGEVRTPLYCAITSDRARS